MLSLALLTVLILFSSCAAVPIASSGETSAEVFTTPEIEEPVWKQLYIDAINDTETSKTYGDFYYELVFIDNDEIPEMTINGSLSFLCVVYDETLKKFELYRGIEYIERENLFLCSAGRWGHVSDTIYTMQNVELKALHIGEKKALSDDDGNPIYNEEDDFSKYYWNGAEVSQEEYQRELEKVFDSSKAVYSGVYSNPSPNYLSPDDMIQKIKDFH